MAGFFLGGGELRRDEGDGNENGCEVTIHVNRVIVALELSANLLLVASRVNIC